MLKKTMCGSIGFSLLLIAVFVSGCSFPKIRGGVGSIGNFGGSFSEAIDREFPAEGLNKVTVDEVNGSVKASFGDVKTVSVRAVKGVKAVTDAKAEELAKEIVVDMRTEGGALVIEVKYPRRPLRGAIGIVDFEIMAPYETWIGADTVNGSIKVAPGSGGAELKTTNGSVEAEGIATGSLRIESTNGRVTAGNVSVRADLETTNGSIIATDCTGETVVETTNGAVRYETAAPPQSDVSLETTNGSISVSVPLSSDLDVAAERVNGSIKSDLPLNIISKSKRSLKGTLNKGGHDLRIETTNGSIRISGTER